MQRIISFIRKYYPFIIYGVFYIGVFHKVFLNQIFPIPGDLLVSWFFPYSSGGWEGFSSYITHKEFVSADVVRQIYPWKHLAIDMLKQGVIPLWNPYAFSGTPLLANVQTAAFYPLNFFFFLFSFKNAWNIYILLQPILGFIFMYLFIRSIGLSKQAALFSGAAFGFMGYLIIWFELGVVGHTALWLPFTLWQITLYEKTKNKTHLMYGDLGLTCAVLAGHIQTAVYLFIICFLYYMYEQIRNNKKELLFNWWFFLLPLGISAIQIFPSIELLHLSARDVTNSSEVFHQFQLPYENLVTIFAPDFFGNTTTKNFWGSDYGEFMAYMGIVAFTFAMIGMWNEKKNYLVKFFSLLGLGGLLFALRGPFSEALFYFRVPVLGTGIPARSLFIFQFCLVVVSAFGIDILLKKKKISLMPVYIVGVVYVLLWLVVLVIPKFSEEPLLSYFAIAKRNLILPSVTFFVTALAVELAYRKQLLRQVIFSVFLVLMVFEYQYFMYKYLPFSPSRYIFPEHPLVTYLQKHTPPQRVSGYYTSHPETNIPTEWRVLSPEGYDPLYNRTYGELLFSAREGKYTERIQRSDAIFVDSIPKEDPYPKQVLLNLLGVKYITGKDDIITQKWNPDEGMYPPDRFSLLWQEDKWKVYENKKALPRAFVAYSAREVIDKEEIIHLLYSKSFPYSSTILINEKVNPSLLSDSKDAPTPAIINEYNGNIVTITANAKRNGMLLLTDAFYPGWKAYVDGKVTPIYRADFAFRAVPITKGAHTIRFIYEPVSFFIGAFVSFLSIGFLVGLIIKLRYAK